MTRSMKLVGLLMALSLVGTTQARAELRDWDEAKVTAAAGELVQAAEAFRLALRRKPDLGLGTRSTAAFWRLRDEMRALVQTSRRLRTALADGSGRDETYPTYRRLLRTARRAKDEARRFGLLEPARGKLEAVADAMRAIRPFYEAEPPL